MALATDTGGVQWKTKLKSGWVGLALVGPDLLAGSAGEVWCLDARDGSVRWHDDLPGLGIGLLSFGTNAPGFPGMAVQEQIEDDQRHTSS